MTGGDPGPPAEGSAAAAAGTHSLDDVRRELRALGYLKDPIGGLMLPASRAEATFLRVSLQTSARAGALGGIVLAAPLVLAVAHLLRPHVRGWRDHLVLGAYLLPLVAAGIFTLNLIGEAAVRAVASGRPGRAGPPGRAERLAARLGAAIAAASSVYLAFLWGLPGGRAPIRGWEAAAAVLLIAGSGLLVGWMARSGALAALASLGARLERPAGGRGALPWIGGAAVAGIAALAGLALARPAPPGPRPMPPIPASTASGRLVVVGVDGLDASWLEDLASGGEAPPALGRIAAGAVRYRIRPPSAPVPPEVWTTLATGVEGEVHGVRSFEVYRLPGLAGPVAAGGEARAARAGLGAALRLLALLGPRRAPAPLSSTLRRSRAVWEVMAAGGIPAAVVNWWGTWPAPAEGVITVSDRALGAFLRAGDKTDAVGPPPAGAGLVHPPALLGELQASFASDIGAAMGRLRAASAGSGREAGGHLEAAFIIDAYHLGVAGRLLRDRPVRALFCYLPGQDIVLGSILEDRGGPGLAGGPRGPRGRAEPASLEAAREVLGAQEILLAELDRGLAGILADLREEDLFVILTDPGRYLRDERPSTARGALWILGGRAGEPGLAGEGAALDVAPSLLALAGLPVAGDLPGRILPGLERAAGRPVAVRSVPTFGDRTTMGLQEAGEGDEEILERLRSLGYIE